MRRGNKMVSRKPSPSLPPEITAGPTSRPEYSGLMEEWEGQMPRISEIGGETDPVPLDELFR